jgi:hypothetical protein
VSVLLLASGPDDLPGVMSALSWTTDIASEQGCVWELPDDSRAPGTLGSRITTQVLEIPIPLNERGNYDRSQHPSKGGQICLRHIRCSAALWYSRRSFSQSAIWQLLQQTV